MPKIPEYNSTVSPQIPNIQRPNLLSAAAPRSAFGEDVAIAQGNFGPKVLDPLSNLLEGTAKIYYDRAEKIKRIDNAVYGSAVNKQFLDEINDKLYSEEEEKGPNGTRIKGYLNRKLNASDGSVFEYDEWYSKKRDEYLSRITDVDTKMSVSQSMDETYLSKRNTLISHEVKQKQAYRENTAIETILSKRKEFGSYQSIESIKAGIADLDKDINLLNDIKGNNAEKAEILRNSHVEKALSRALETSMLSDPTGKNAKKLIAGLTGEVPGSMRTSLRKMVDSETEVNKNASISAIKENIITNGASPDIIEQIKTNKDLIGVEASDKLLKDVIKIQQTQINSLYSSGDLNDKQKSLIDTAQNTIEGFIFDKHDQANLNTMLIDLMKDGLDKNEAKIIQQKIDEILGNPEQKSGWQSITKKINTFNANVIGGILHSNPVKLFNLFSAKDADGAEILSEKLMRDEYNKAYPEAPLSKDEKVIDPKRERPIVFRSFVKALEGYTDLQIRNVRGLSSGITGSVAGIGAGMEMVAKTNAAKKIAGMFGIEGKAANALMQAIGKSIHDKSSKLSKDLMVDDPTLYDEVLAGFGSTATFFVPGLGITKGLQLAGVVGRMAYYTGLSASSIMEGIVEGGTAYKEAIERGVPDKEAVNLGSAAALANLPVLFLTNRLGLFGDEGTKIAKSLNLSPGSAKKIGNVLSAGLEGAQEFFQTIIGNIADNDTALKDGLKSATIGVIVGAVGSVLSQDAVNNLEQLEKTSKAWEDFKKKIFSEEGTYDSNASKEPPKTGFDYPEESDWDEDIPISKAEGSTESSLKNLSDKELVKELSDLVSNFEGPQTVIDMEGNYSRLSSGWMEGFTNKGYTKKYLENIYSKYISGKPLTKNQQNSLIDTLNAFKELHGIVPSKNIPDVVSYEDLAKSRANLAIVNSIGKFLSRTIPAGEVKGTVNKATGVSIKQDKLYTERQALRESLRRQARVAAKAVSATTKDLNDIKKSIVESIKILPQSDRGKFNTMIANAVSSQDLAKATLRIERVLEQSQKKQLIEEIKRSVRTTGKAKNIAVEYIDQIKGLVNGIDLVNRRQDTIDRLQKTQDFINKAKAAGENIDIPQRIARNLLTLSQKPISSVTNAELSNLLDDINSLRQIGAAKLRTRKSIDTLLKQKDLAALKTTSKQINSETTPRKLPNEEIFFTDKFKKRYQQTRRSLTEFEMNMNPMDVVFDILDGNMNYEGQNYRIFKNRIDTAYSAYLQMKHPFQYYILKKADELKLSMKDFELIGIHAAREQQGGMEKLIASGFTEEQINSVRLNDKQMELYLAMRQKLDEMRPYIEETMRTSFNQKMNQVQNYFSFMTDFDSMSSQEVRELYGNNVSEFGQAPRKNVQKGFTKERVGGAQKIKINALEIYLNHIDNAAYLVNLGKDIKYLGELAKSDQYRQAVGDIGQKIVVNWIDVLARKGGDGSKRIKWLDHMRSNIGAATLGYKLSSALIQPTALMDGAALIGKYSFSGFHDVITSKENRQFIFDNFEEIKARVGDDPSYIDYDKFDATTKLKQAGYAPLKYLDALTSSGVAMGAYKKYLNKNNIEFDVTKPNKKAIEYAQKIVRRTQASGMFKDMPLIFTRGDAMGLGNVSINKAALQFQSFLFNRWSLIKHDFYTLGIKGGDRKKAANIAFFLILANIAEMGTRHISKEIIDFLTDGDFDDDKEEDYSFIKDFAINLAQNVPFAGSAISLLEYNSIPVPTINAVARANDALENLKRSKKTGTKVKNTARLLTNISSLAGIPGSAQADQLIREVTKKEKGNIKRDRTRDRSRPR